MPQLADPLGIEKSDPLGLDSVASPDPLGIESTETKAAPFKGALSAWQQFSGGVAKGAANLMNEFAASGIALDESLPAEDRMRMFDELNRRTPGQRRQDLLKNPLYQAGVTAAEAVPLTPEEQRSKMTRAGQFVGGAGGMALGPLAIPAFTLDAVGRVNEDFQRIKQENPKLSDDEASAKALTQAWEKGAVTATVFAALPKVLRAPLEKYVVDKMGKSGFQQWLGGRVASSIEGGIVLGTQAAGERAVEGHLPDSSTLGAAAGGAAMNLLLPWRQPRNRAGDNIEAELGSSQTPDANPQTPSGIIPPERQLRAPAIQMPGPGGFKQQSVMESIAEADALLRDLPPVEQPSRPPDDLTKGGVIPNGSQETQGRQTLLNESPPTPETTPAPIPTAPPSAVKPSQAASQPGAGETPPVPEPLATLEAQVAATLDPQSSKAVTLVTPGAEMPQSKGLVSVETALGTALVNAKKVAPAEAKAALDAGQGGQLLGMSTEAKPEGGNAVLETRTPEGVPVQQEVVNAETLRQAQRAGQSLAPTGTQEIKPPHQVIEERLSGIAEQPTSTAIDPGQVRTVEFPVKDLRLSRDVPNFKAGASETTGTVKGNELAGRYERRGTAPIVAWQRLNGETEVITGRHRFDLAKRTGEKTIPTQLVREADGFTKAMALTFDAEANIRDGQGEVSDYATYFKHHPEYTEAEARARGLLSRAKGRAGWDVGKNATDDVYALWRDGKISDAQAVAIANSAPGEAGAQRIGSKFALQGKSADFISNVIKASRAEAGTRAQSLDLFGNDDSAMKAMAEQAERASKFQRDIAEQIRAVSGAAKRPEIARKLGVDVRDPEAIVNKITELKGELARWENWPLQPDLVAKVKGEKFELAQPESVAEQKSRLAQEASIRETQLQRDKLAAEASKPLEGTAGDLGQGDLLKATDDLFAPPTPPKADILDKAQAAVEGRIDEIKREGRLRAFGDPELAGLRSAQGAIYILKGAKNFAEWSAQMVKRFGREIEPHLRALWDEAGLIAKGEHPTIGLSEHGVKAIANEELSASVRDAVNVHYAKLTDEAARTIATARITEAGGPMPAVARMMAGGFDGEPGKIQNAIAASVMRMLSFQEKGARGRGADAQADAIADAQVAVAQRSIDRSPDAGQTLQSFKMFYEQFAPAAWLRKFKKDVGNVAVQRTEAATGKPVEPTPAGVATGIADAVGDRVAQQNPKLGQIIQEEFGRGRAQANPNNEPLATRLERTGRAAKGKGQQMAAKVSAFYKEEVAKFRRLHGIPEFDPATQRDILNRAKAIDALPVDSVQRRQAALELMNHLRRMKGFERWELPLDFWYANILSGPGTHLKNISGNVASLGAEVSVQIVRNPKALPSILEALGRALPRGATEAANIMRTGYDTAARHGGKFETHGALDAVDGMAGKILLPWKMVGRALKAADVMFFYPLQEVKGAQLASRESGLPVFGGRRAADVRRVMGWTEAARTKAEAQVKAEGLTGNLAQRRTYELLEQARPETLMDNARDFAFQGTFNNDVYGVLGTVQRGFESMARGVPALKLIAPFTRIITNITNSGMNWTPVGAWRAARGQGLKLLIGRESNTGKLYGKEITDPTAIGDAYTRATIGTLAIGGLAMAAGQYIFDRNPQLMVTGSGPTDPDQKKQLREAGWIPYSIKIGDRYYTYQDKTWALPLGIVGHYMDAVRYRKLDQQDALNRAAFALGSAANVIVQSSWLQGLSAIFDQAGRDSVKNPLKALPQQALRTASSFVVPNALRQLDTLFDPTQYKADDIRAMMIAQIPFARRNNQPALNVFGEPVAVPLSKQFMSKVEGDGLTRMLAGRRLWPSVPLDPYLTPAQSYALLKYRGVNLRTELLANYADIATLPHADAQKLVESISGKVTRQAKKDLGLDTLSGIEKQVQKFEEQ